MGISRGYDPSLLKTAMNGATHYLEIATSAL